MKHLAAVALIVLSFTILTDAKSGNGTLCDFTAGVLSDAVITASGHCFSEPDYYAITFYEIGFCPAAPAPPTTTTTSGIAACNIIFTSVAGMLVEIKKGVTTILSGSFTKPPVGSYTHGYVKMGLSFLIKNSTEINTSVAADSGVGVHCFTQDKTISSQDDDNTPPRAKCQVTAPELSEVGTLTEIMDEFGGSFSNTRAAGAGIVSAYVIKSTGLLLGAGEHAQAANILGVQAFNTPVKFTDDTSVMDMAFEVSKGMTIQFSDSKVLNSMASGPFSVNITVD